MKRSEQEMGEQTSSRLYLDLRTFLVRSISRGLVRWSGGLRTVEYYYWVEDFEGGVVGGGEVEADDDAVE